jgi:hypothetical protein
MAFIRFSVVDNNNNHTISQRIMPLKQMRQGYHHVRLRNMQNESLELASLFVCTRQQVEHVEQQSLLKQSNQVNSGLYSSTNDIISANNQSSMSKAKHKQFKLTVFGLNGDDEDNDSGVQVKVTQETTVQQVIEQVGFKFSL